MCYLRILWKKLCNFAWYVLLYINDVYSRKYPYLPRKTKQVYVTQI